MEIQYKENLQWRKELIQKLLKAKNSVISKIGYNKMIFRKIKNKSDLKIMYQFHNSLKKL